MGEVSGLNGLGSTYYVLRKIQKGIELFQQALAKSQEINFYELAPIRQKGALQLQSNALAGLSLGYRNLGEYDTAIEFAKQRLTYVQTLNKPDWKAEAVLSLGELYTDLRDFPKAIESTQQALTIARQIKDSKLETQALQQLSQAYTKQGNHPQALESANQALQIAKRLENTDIEQRILDEFNDIYNNQGNYQKALEFAQQRLMLLRQTNKGSYENSALYSLSRSFLALGDTQKAIEVASQVLENAQQQQNPGWELQALATLGEAYTSQGEFDQAIDAGQKSLAIAQKIKDFRGEAWAASVLSQAYQKQGDYQKVIAVAEPGLVSARKYKRREQEAELLMNLGDAYQVLGEYSKGKEFIEQSLAIARELKNPALESMALAYLGNLYNNSNEFQKSLELNQKSLKIADEIKSPPAQAIPQFELGDVYYSLGDYPKSRDYYQQALATMRQLKNRQGEGVALLNIASTYFVRREPQKTVEFAQQALAIFQEIKVPGLEAFANKMLSTGYGELGNDATAMETAQTFLDFTRKTQNSIWEKQALTLIGSLHRKFGRKEQAIAAYQQALAITTDNQVTGGDAYIYAGLARIYRDLNQPNIAIGYYKQSVNKIEEVRRNIQGLPPELQKSFLEAIVDFDRVKISDIYRQLAALLLSQGRDKEALQVQQLMREQEIREAISPRGNTGDKPNIPLTPTETKIPPQSESIIALAREINECESTKCSQLKELTTRRTSLIVEFDQQLQKIDQEIRANRAKDDAFFDPNKLAKAQEIVEAQPGTVMIYPLVLENELWLQLYAQGGAVKTVKVNVTRDELGNAVKEFRDLMNECEKVANCGSAEATKVQAVSLKLYNWLMKDLEAELQNKNSQVKNLVFALDRVTRYIPMSALYDGKQYLIEKYTIYNVLTEDTDTRDKLPVGTQNSPVLAMGLSDAVPGFSPLPNVPAEIDAIVRQDTKNNHGIYPGQKFLNRAFDFATLQDNLKGYKILHLATHGVFVPDSADKSYILLGTGEQLTIPQIKTLTGLSNIHLVVLSACQTALAGPRQDGIEIASMAYHFLNRGAKAVMASLWLVDDGSTSLLMQQFYKNLANSTSEKPMTKAEALRQAQLNLLQGNVSTAANTEPRGGILVEQIPDSRPPITPSNGSEFSHPYYWAPFILIGNGL
ncbi:CHAT domain-containing protein [Coleofasciculus sp. H7-2]|uniref:CHAT domain-containing protein n=1 Tax=Coleofasciculus sp. H7-2 TaxID=3351545 RepID=UPI00366D5592